MHIWQPPFRNSAGSMKRRSKLEPRLPSTPNSRFAANRAGAQSDNSVFLKLRERVIEGMRKAGVPDE
jgi:hypothetical protein